jgi:dTDP-4-dehydrorhamnose 3,5-epimerase
MSSRFDLVGTPIPGLMVAVRKALQDERGWLERVFCADELAPLMGGRRIAQINRTLTASAGTVRGLHYQRPPAADMKLVTCLRGQVMDVAVDVRRGSPTFLRWHAGLLTGDNRRTVVIPEGFAHGFQTLTDDCELLYLHTNVYVPDLEGGLDATDPRLGIDWPLPVGTRSDRDRNHPTVTPAFQGIPS